MLLEHTSDAILALDAELKVVHANGKAAALFRRPLRDLLGVSLLSHFPELRGSPSERQLEASRRSAVATKFEMFVPSLFCWFAVLAVPRPSALVLFVRDVTERARREQDEAVRSSVARIVEDLSVCVMITRGKEHRIELVNARARELVAGRSVEGELVERALPETREQGFIALLDAVFASGTRMEAEERLMEWKPHPDQPVKRGYFNLAYQPLFGPAGEVTGILHLGIEVSELVHRRQMIADYAAEREAVLQQLSEGVIIADAVGRITFVNEAAKKLHGVAVLDVKPQGYSETYNLFTEDGRPFPPEELPLTQAVKFNREVLAARWRIRRPQGTEVLVEGNAKPVISSSGARIGSVLTLRLLEEVRPAAQ